VLRALSLCTCCRHYPGTATDGPALLTHSVVSAFPERVVGSACASSFSRLTQRSLTLRPAHSCCHQNLWPAIRRLQPFRYLHDCSGYFRLEHFAGWGSHPLENAAFSRRTPIAAIEPDEHRMTGSSPSADIHSSGKRAFPIWASDIAAAPDAHPNAPALGDARCRHGRARIAAPSGVEVRIRSAHRTAGAGNVKAHKRKA
jgi:hypothetical protein